jgi:hypothetical protein
MSVFIVIMPSPVFSDSPPLSKVIPYEDDGAASAGRVIGELQQAGRLVGSGRDAHQAAEAFTLDGHLVEYRDRQSVLFGDLAGHLFKTAWSLLPRGLVDQVAREAGRPADGGTPVEGALYGRAAPTNHRNALEGARLAVALVLDEAIGPERCPFGEGLGGLLLDLRRSGCQQRGGQPPGAPGSSYG